MHLAQCDLPLSCASRTLACLIPNQIVLFAKNNPRGMMERHCVIISGVMNSRQLIAELESAGWVLDRISGSHHVFKHPDHPQIVTVPHPRKDLPKGTVKQIRRSAGLRK